ncbi:MAG: SMC family ATPase [Bacteroidota bacterium]
MLPISLTLKGLYSYQHTPQVIDFTRLREGQLFGIFGATGSGKSSILEAITFALYGESERLSRKDKRGYNMMNLRSDELLIDFIFEQTGTRYRFITRHKRNRKQFDKVGKSDRSAYKWEQEEWVPIQPDSVAEIVGLTYDHFRQTIIIPQGKFQEFLQLTDTERTRMLREIFGLEKFELYDKTVKVEARTQSAWDTNNALLSQLANVTPDVVQVTQEEIHKSEASLHLLQKRQEDLVKKRQQLEEVQALMVQLTKTQQALAALDAQAAEMEQRETQLNQYQEALATFHPLLVRKRDFQDEIHQLEKRLHAIEVDQESQRAAIGKLQKIFPTIKEQFLDRDQILRKAEELEQVVDLREKEQILQEQQARIPKGEGMIREIQLEIEDLEAKLKSGRERTRQLRENLPDTGEVIAVQRWFDEASAIQKEIQREQEHLTSFQEFYLRLENTKRKLVQQVKLDPSQASLDFPQIAALIDQLNERNQQQVTTLTAELANLKARQEMSAYVQDLQEGKPCPVCGATHHPQKSDPAAMETAIAQLADKLNAARQSAAQSIDACNQVQVLLQELDKNTQEQQTTQQSITQLQGRQIDHKQQFTWSQYDPDHPEKLADILQLSKMAEAETQQLHEQAKAQEAVLEKKKEQLKKYREAVAAIQAEVNQLEVAFQTRVGSLQTLKFEAFKGMEAYHLQQEAQTHRKRYEEVEQLFEETEKQLLQHQQQLAMLKGEQESAVKRKKEVQSKLALAVQEMLQLLTEASFASLESIDNILANPINIQTERSELIAFRNHRHATQQQEQQLILQIGPREFNQAKFDTLLEQLETITEEITLAQRKLGGFQQELERLNAQLKEKEVLEKKGKALALRLENINTLKKMFRQSGFVNYVSGVFLQNLCLMANDRFRKLTRGALSLEISADNNFEVRDYLHGGQLRSIKTLSGGQTFQAALSLALALAAQVQQQAKAHQNFFFIDEGFGSQDRESLGVIFETLKSLRKENRIVGIISHVEELQQEIDTCLFVKNDPEKGSLVTNSWE